MARVVDRFAVCDLDRDRCQYYERRGQVLYPEEGSYRQLMEQVSRRYVVLTDSENAKITQMLAPGSKKYLQKRTPGASTDAPGVLMIQGEQLKQNGPSVLLRCIHGKPHGVTAGHGIYNANSQVLLAKQ